MGIKNTEISARIAEIIERAGESPNSFAKRLGYSRAQTIYDILSGKSAPSYDFFNRFANTEYSANISLQWLLTGKGEMLKDKHINYQRQKELAYHVPEGSHEGIPLIPVEAMAGALTSERTVLEYECERYVVPVFKGADFLIPVKDHPCIRNILQETSWLVNAYQCQTCSSSGIRYTSLTPTKEH